MPSKMRKDIYILVKDRTFIRSASFPRVMTHFYFLYSFSSSDYAVLSEHSCSSDYSRIFADLALRPLANAVVPT